MAKTDISYKTIHTISFPFNVLSHSRFFLLRDAAMQYIILSVSHTRVSWQKERTWAPTADILIPHERAITLVF